MDIITQQKNNNLQTATKYFDDLLSLISVKHQNKCDCTKKLYEEQYKIIYDIEVQRLKDDGLFDDDNARSNRLKEVEWFAKQKVSEICDKQGIRCNTERGLIAGELSLFVDKYDLSDPKVYVIVKNALKLALTEHRLGVDIGFNDVIYETESKNGNIYRNINPAVEAAYKYNEACIKAIETLHKLTEGEKHTITIKTFQDVLEEVKQEMLSKNK